MKSLTLQAEAQALWRVTQNIKPIERAASILQRGLQVLERRAQLLLAGAWRGGVLVSKEEALIERGPHP